MAAFLPSIGTAKGSVRRAHRSVCVRRHKLLVRASGSGDEEPSLRPPPRMDDVLKEDEDEILMGLEDALTKDERRLRRPNDPTELQTESERRRKGPTSKNLRRRRMSRGADNEELDWDNMETRPLVKPKADPQTGEDYWIDFTLKKEAPKKRRSKPVDSNLRERLKRETASPYKNNWIGIIVVAVFILVVLYNVLPNEAPIIPIPDL
eukprot:Plantae.Rhodophyta-Purpureofilum_apyrenoidigerum.ctg12124.p2 GENE.Plantae.Rhodophyta-Purpureofilum_apyrenoidigerum.ctg12124~~Plantae.Rhodophyta-Purpureofilum_apyrenoidigerum.ctg12124.p2  ORF type:complete len:207 (-),score=38.25 Plantae.Rhodophyta-Purpureofilum_apyrenoidigerum.ctg12124:889-1509(-)